MDTPLQRMLQLHFGYTTFRDGQETLVNGLLSGRDVMGIMPTGGGKSICYQLPALMLPGITLVISPLISLMQDQVLALKTAGIPAAYINSTLSPSQIRTIYHRLSEGYYKIVYIAPERLNYGGFGALAASLPLSLIAVDEAHCISQWGQDFRPSYLRIVNFLNSLPQRPPVGAFTATATTRVQEDIKRALRLNTPVTIITGFDRPNLYFSVQRPSQKDPTLLELLSSRRNKSGIIYCTTRKKVEHVCELLQENGFVATRYHAGLDETERRCNQEDFLYDRCTVMVATNAFGMGIDKSNVSYVIHYNMPLSLEAYYQEAGRAGRDGAPADCILLFNSSDARTARFLINNSAENDELAPKEREIIRQQDIARLSVMEAYCKSTHCLRGQILSYFGQTHSAACGNCSSCNSVYERIDVTREAQMLLSCVKRIEDKLGYAVGITTVLRVLRGSHDKRLLSLGLDSLSTYALLKGADRTTLRRLAEYLEEAGYLITESEHDTVRLTPRSSAVLFRGEKVVMVTEKKRARAITTAAMSESDTALYDRLREQRAKLASNAGIPAYVIVSNATLMDMARKRPHTQDELLNVSGIGETKAARYGERFLQTIRRFENG